MVGIYKITSPNNKVYIGQSWDIERRMYHHKYYHAKLKGVVYSSMKKYGVENFTFDIIHELPIDITQSTLDAYEILYMGLYGSCYQLLNTREGGSKGKMSEVEKIRLGELKKGNTNMLGKKHSEKTKKQMSDSAMGKKKSEITKSNISKGRQGMKLSDGHKKKISESGKGRIPNDATRLKMSKWQLGRDRGDEFKDKVSKSKLKDGAAFRIQVLDTNNGVVFKSIKEAAISIGVMPSQLSAYLNGRYVNKTSFIKLNKEV